jgi:hypothetical protein
MFYFLNIFSANKVATLCSVAPLYYVSVLQRLFRWPKAANTFLESRMFASPALCHSTKTRTQCLSGRTENNNGTLVSEQAWNTGLSECCTQNHGTATCQPHTHLRNGILSDTSRASLFAHYAFTPPPPPSYSKCTLLPSIPPLRQSTVLPPGQLGYYNVAWGLTKVVQKVLAAVSRLRHR